MFLAEGTGYAEAWRRGRVRQKQSPEMEQSSGAGASCSVRETLQRRGGRGRDHPRLGLESAGVGD